MNREIEFTVQEKGKQVTYCYDPQHYDPKLSDWNKWKVVDLSKNFDRLEELTDNECVIEIIQELACGDVPDIAQSILYDTDWIDDFIWDKYEDLDEEEIEDKIDEVRCELNRVAGQIFMFEYISDLPYLPF